MKKKLKEEKLSQLKNIFNKCVKNIIDEIKNSNLDINDTNNIERQADLVANQLVYEVKIRI